VVKVACATRKDNCVGAMEGQRANFGENVSRRREKTFWTQEKQIEGRKCITINAAIRPLPYFLRSTVLAVEDCLLRMGFAAEHYSIVPELQHLPLPHLRHRMTARRPVVGERCFEVDLVVSAQQKMEGRYCRIDNDQAALEQTNFQCLSVCRGSRRVKLASAVADRHNDWLLPSYLCMPGADW